MKIFENKPQLLFFLILILLFFLRFWGLTANGVQHDAAINAVRAAGWLDFLAGSGQTSPISWFGEIPWWGSLSFHDHPPLVFWVENLSLKIFGENTFGVLVPFALAAMATGLILYYLVKKFISPSAGLWAILAFAVSSYATWVSRAGYLEGIEYLFLALSIFFFAQYLDLRRGRFLAFWAGSVGLALLSKYTAIFLLPAAVLYLLFWDWRVLKTKIFWLSLLLIPAVLSPVIVYNFQVFQATGHFDAALSSMLGMHPQDFEVIASRGINFNLGANFWSILDSLVTTASLPFLVLQGLALLFALGQVVRRKAGVLTRLLLLHILMIVVMFAFAGAQPRFLAILTPFLTLNLGIVLYEWWGKIATRPGTAQALAGGGLLLIFALELGYGINTNLLTKPLGRERIFYSPNRFYSQGFGELEQYLRDEVFVPLPPRRHVTKLEELTYFDVKEPYVVIIDARADWFATMWHVNRYSFYYNAPIVHFLDFHGLMKETGDAFAYLRKGGAVNFWFVLTTPAGIVGSPGDEEYQGAIRQLQALLERSRVQPQKFIKNSRGQTVFEIYEFSTAASASSGGS